MIDLAEEFSLLGEEVCDVPLAGETVKGVSVTGRLLQYGELGRDTGIRETVVQGFGTAMGVGGTDQTKLWAPRAVRGATLATTRTYADAP